LASQELTVGWIYQSQLGRRRPIERAISSKHDQIDEEMAPQVHPRV
jgi:hypothetical protein